MKKKSQKIQAITTVGFKKDLPEYWNGTLKEYRAEYGRVVKMGDREQAKYLGYKIVSTRKYARKTIRYAKHCSRWGDYGPETYIEIVTRIKAKKGAKDRSWTEFQYSENVGKGSRGRFCHSEISQIKTTKYRRCEVHETVIVFEGREYPTGERELRIGNTHFHIEGNTKTRQGYKELLLKIEKQKEKKKEYRRNTKGCISLSRLRQDYGWCECGLDYVKETLNVTSNWIKPKDGILKWQEASEETKTLLSMYRQEIAEFLTACRRAV